MLKKKSINLFFWCGLACLACTSSIIIVSCSSNTTKKVNNTTFSNEYNISQEANLNNFISTECKTYFANHHDALLSLILNKVVSGYKNELTWDKITFNIDEAVADNNAATLKIVYEMKSYWANNVLVDENPKDLTVILNGFKRPSSPTVFIDSKTKVVTDTSLAAYTVNAILNDKSILTRWLFANEITGNKQSLNENNLMVTFSETNKVEGKLTATYEMSKYWSDRGLASTPIMRFTIAMNGFIQTPQTEEEILANINPAGTLNNLQIDQYQPVIAHFNISNSTRLETINQTYLDQIKIVPDFELLNLSVVSGSQATSLVLKLTGKYQNVAIPDAKSLITITGFKTNSAAYDINSSMWINVMNLNSEKYYNDLQTEQKMQTWSTAEWVNYLKELKSFSGGGSVLDIFGAIQNKTLSNIVFGNATAAIAQDDWTLFTLEFDYINYRYASNNWVEDSKQSYRYKMDTKKQLIYLTDADAMQYTVGNQVKLIPSETASKYASYWYAQTKILTETIETILEIDPVYEQTYFAGRQIIVELVENSMVVDDWNGIFSFSYKLVLPDDLSSPYNQAYMEVNNCLKLNTYVCDNTQDATFSTAQIKTMEPQISVVTRILKSVKQEFTNEEISALTVNQENLMATKPEYFRVQSSSYIIYNSEASTDVKFDNALINNIADFRLFSKTVNSALISTETNLFDRRNNNGGFYLDTLRVNFPSTTKASLTKLNNGFLQYKVPFVYELGILGYSEDISGYYFYNISLSELGYN